MKVIDKFQAAKALQKLPDDFKIIKVPSNSLMDNILRRLCRSIEDQLGLDKSNIDHDPIAYLEFLKQTLDNELYNTSDLSSTLVVLGNKSGALSGRQINVLGSYKQFMDINDIPEKYPIFLDTSAIKALNSDSTSSDLKREREETFTVLTPPSKRPEAEKFSEIQNAWFEREQELQGQINSYRKLFDSATERNEILAHEASDNQNAYEQTIETLKQKVHDLQSQPMDYDSSQYVTMEDFENVRHEKDELTNQIEHLSRNQVPLIAPMQSGSSGGSETTTKPWTLTHYGLRPWNPDTSSFLDYVICFRAALKGVASMPEDRYIQLLFSALPAKYSYLMGAIPSDSKGNFEKVQQSLIRMIVGGHEKIFTEFISCQKRTHENMLEYYQRVVQFYCFSNKDSKNISDIENDPVAYKLIKDKISKAYPSRLVTEFKRKLESKSSIKDIFNVILDINDNFTENYENSNNYSGHDINALRQGKTPDWHKSAKCHFCGKKGHIKANCYKREGKTKKKGGKFKN